MEIKKIEQVVFIVETIPILKPVVAAIIIEEIEGYLLEQSIGFSQGQALKSIHRLPDLHVESLVAKLEELLDIEQLKVQASKSDPMRRVQNVLDIHSHLLKLKPAGVMLFGQACGVDFTDCDKIETLVEKLETATEAEIASCLEFAKIIIDRRLRKYDD